MEHQDWKPVIVRTKKPSDSKKSSYKGSQKNQKDSSIEKKADNDTLKHKQLTLQMRQTIQKARTSKGLTQKELANQCRLPVAVINEIESGKAIYNHQHIEKIKRILQLKLTN